MRVHRGDRVEVIVYEGGSINGELVHIPVKPGDLLVVRDDYHHTYYIRDFQYFHVANEEREEITNEKGE